MTRILFVDDEVMILQGLRNLLRKQRNQWHMVFVSSGDEALKRLEQEPFDIVVSDMRMPKMDGATLLRQVKDRYPAIVRIVLSGYSESEVALKTVPIAHQFLAKPCEAATLRNVIDRAGQLSALLTDEAIRSLVGSMDRLPPVPSIYLALTRALDAPRVSMDEIERLVEQDVAISARVLQVVNSAFFGPPKPIGSVPHAVTHLGINVLKRILLSVETFNLLDSPGIEPYSAASMQAHSVRTATLASSLFRERTKSEEAFAAGLLHDVGKLVLGSCAPEKLKVAAEASRNNREPLHVAEHRLYGVSHAEVGAYLLGIWGLPYSTVEAVAYHHNPGRLEHAAFDVLDAVHVADYLITETLHSPQSDGLATLDMSHMARLGVADQVDGWRERASSLVERATVSGG